VLRHSLHRAGTEILYLPLSSPVRDSFKTLVEALGQRGGQAFASIGILGAVTLHAGIVPIAVALSLLSALALLTLVGLGGEYVERFRDRLRTLVGDTRTDVPELDLNSLETLVSTLSSPSDAEVLAALDLLESYGRGRLVPPLILHHASEAVVLRALELFRATDHPHLAALRQRLLEHEAVEVRAAVLRTWPGAGPDVEVLLRVLREDPSPAVRSTALACWASRPDSDPRVVERTLGELVSGDRIEGRLALASALPKLPAELASRFARELARDPSPAVAEALADSLGATPELRFVPVLVELLARREAREAARDAIVALGEEGLATLARLLEAPETADAVRRHLPRTISRLPGAGAARILTDALGRSEPRVRYKILRGLGRMRARNPGLEVDAAPLLAEAGASLERAVAMLRLQIAYALRSELKRAGTSRAELLAPLLEEKEQRALERVFRVLHILEPQRDYAVIFDALRRGDAAYRAICHELLEHVVAVPIRDGMLALTSSGTPLERLRDALTFFEPEGSARLIELASGAGRVSELPDPDQRELEAVSSRVLGEAARDPDTILAAVLAYQLPELVGPNRDEESARGG
jgi:AAA family ATP:ADP antiporter